MAAPFDVAVIGAGVVGAAVARALSAFDLRTVLIEAGPDVGTGTSKANTAILHTGFDAAPGSMEARLVAHLGADRGYGGAAVERFVRGDEGADGIWEGLAGHVRELRRKQVPIERRSDRRIQAKVDEPVRPYLAHAVDVEVGHRRTAAKIVIRGHRLRQRLHAVAPVGDPPAGSRASPPARDAVPVEDAIEGARGAR